MKLSQRHRRIALGVLASLAAHVVLIAVFFGAKRRLELRLPPPPPRQPAIQVVIQRAEGAPARPGGGEPQGPRAAPSLEQRQQRMPSAAASKKRKPAVPVEAAPTTPTPPAAVAEAPALPPAGDPSTRPSDGIPRAGPAPDPWSAEWREAEGLAVPRGTGRPGGLATTLDGKGVGDALGMGPATADELPRAEPIVPESGAVARRRVAGRIDGFAKSFNAHERAQVPDVYWRNLRDELARNFDVPYEVFDKGSRGGGRAQAFAQQLQRDLGSYGKTGNPYGSDPNAPGARRNLAGATSAEARERNGLPESAMAQVEMMQRGFQAFTTRSLVARILVSQKDDGKIADVALVDTSGNKVYDRMALNQARLLLDKELSQLGPLPPQGRRSLWAFETDFSVMPPVPMVGCGLDAYFVPRDCYYPGKTSARSRVRLEAIY